jgi:hypothetical protein
MSYVHSHFCFVLVYPKTKRLNTFFLSSALALRISFFRVKKSKKSLLLAKQFFLEISQYGYKKTRMFVLILDLKKNYKKHQKSCSIVGAIGLVRPTGFVRSLSKAFLKQFKPIFRFFIFIFVHRNSTY